MITPVNSDEVARIKEQLKAIRHINEGRATLKKQ
jgi:hypothetical protein